MLSADELMAIRTSKSKPKPLPLSLAKDFNPTFLPDETNHIRYMINERLLLVKEERAERKNLLSKAIWMPNEGLARIDKLVGGGWDCYGFQKSGKLHLYPEEALFLMETMKLELWYVEAPISLQQAYALLQQPHHCSPSKYQVYAHLSRQGYKVQRNPTYIASGKRNLHFTEFSSNKRVCGDPKPQIPEFKKKFRPSAADKDHLDRIPDFGISGTVELRFDEPNLIPESCRNRLKTYTIPIETGNNNTKPLILVNGRVDLSRLKIFKSEPNYSPEDSELEIVFDVYSPGPNYRKSSPGVPNFSVAITEWTAPFPSLSTQQQLLAQCSKETTLVMAITGQGNDVSFYQLRNTCKSPCCP